MNLPITKPNPLGGKLIRRAMPLIGVMGLLLGINFGYCGETSFTEYQVKALFLLNFTKYVIWPAEAFADSDAPFTIGVFGDNRFGDNLKKAVAGKSVGGRGIAIRQMENSDDPGKCFILFISNSEKRRTAEILGKIRNLPVLTVGEIGGFIDQDGMINLTMKDGKVGLEINLQAAQRAGLQLSSKLLSVASTVKGRSR